jgi:hypothetical protein
VSLPPLHIVRAGELEGEPEGPCWLIESLWPHSAVGIVGGQPKSMKSWLALDLALSVASHTDCLGRYPVLRPGRALIYLAEDALPDVRARLDCLCRSRGLPLDRLDLHVVAEPILRLDHETDRRRLDEALGRLRPRLLVLDPLVRLHRLDENSSTEISGLLGYLREIQRRHDVSVVLVHHTSKRSQARHGQALRGSSDLHAWTDVGLYLTWHGERLRLTPELRTARACAPVEIRLVDEDPAATHLTIRMAPGGGPEEAGPSLTQRILDALRRAAPAALTRSVLRAQMRVNNGRLGAALDELERLGFACRSPHGWRAERA